MSNLQQRLKDVFSILEEHNPHVQQPAWSISDSAVRVPGTDSASESDDDAADHNECVEVLRMVEDEEGEATMACKMPSSTACKAFNEEDEEDEFDRIACESLQRLRCRPKPALKTQVAERNIYDRMMCTSTSPLSPTCPPNTPTLAQLTAPMPPSKHGSARKKVRFREEDEYCEAPAAECDEAERMPREAGPSPQLRQKLITGEAATAAPRETDAHTEGSPRALVAVASCSKSGASKTTYVPEHVRRPEAFTCYELDTPIVVGSGVDGSTDTLTAGSVSDKAVLGTGAVGRGRVFSGLCSSTRGNNGLQGCLKQPDVGEVVASNLRFAGLPAAEYLRPEPAALQQVSEGAQGASQSLIADMNEDTEPPEMVAFVPGKSSRSRARSGAAAEAMQLPHGVMDNQQAQQDVRMAVGCAAPGAGPSTAVQPMNSQCEVRRRGVLSVSAADEEGMDVDECANGAAAEMANTGAMQLAFGSLDSALGAALSCDGGLKPKPVSMRDGGMTFEFPMDSSQQAVGGVGALGSGVGFLSTPSSRSGQKNRRGRRNVDE